MILPRKPIAVSTNASYNTELARVFPIVLAFPRAAPIVDEDHPDCAGEHGVARLGQERDLPPADQHDGALDVVGVPQLFLREHWLGYDDIAFDVVGWGEVGPPRGDDDFRGIFREDFPKVLVVAVHVVHGQLQALRFVQHPYRRPFSCEATVVVRVPVCVPDPRD